MCGGHRISDLTYLGTASGVSPLSLLLSSFWELREAENSRKKKGLDACRTEAEVAQTREEGGRLFSPFTRLPRWLFTG